MNKRIVYFVTVSLALLGLMAFFRMPREEDPRIKERNAIARVVVPGATPDRIFRQVVRPIEDELGKVGELKKLSIEIRLNVAIFQLELIDEVKDIPLAWRRVERAIEKSKSRLPESIQAPVLDFSVLDIESIVFALVGSGDLERIDAANRLKDAILKNEQVSEVRIFGNPEIEIRTEVDEKKLHGLGLSIPQLIHGITQKNSGAQTGFYLDLGERVVIDQNNDLSTIQELENLQFETRNFKSVHLKDFSDTKRTIQDPPQSIFRWNGQPAVGVGVVAKQGLNIESFGSDLLKNKGMFEEVVFPSKIETVAYQPQRTNDRIDDLLMSLLTGMGLIAVLLALLMGPMTALIVTLLVPIISLVGLYFYYLTGGVLHQISIAAFIISIGQFIDNIVVVVDQMQTRLNNGESTDDAVSATSKSLKWPLAFATLTGVCAFIPMYSAQGSTADFVTALPLVAMITLVVSYFVTLFFAPVFSAHFIRTRTPGRVDQAFALLEKLFSNLALGPLWRVGLLVIVIFIMSVVGLLNVKKEFFPESDRNEFLFTLELNQSSDISSTDKIINDVEGYLKSESNVTAVASFAGGDIPRFYYNIPNFQRSPHVGQLLLTVKPKTDLKALGIKLESHFRQLYPDVSFVSLFLQQGPPIQAKVEVRFFSEDPARRQLAYEYLKQKLDAHPMLRAVRVDRVSGLRLLKAESKEDSLASLGLTNADVNRVMSFYSTGVPVSLFRFERSQTALRLRASEDLNMQQKQLSDSIAVRGRDRDFKIGDLVDFKNLDAPPVIRRKNSETYLRALADMGSGYTFSQVDRDINEMMSQFPKKSSERFELGGDAEGAGQANQSIFKVVPIAMALLVLFLLLEFRSFRKVFISMLALPITILGVFPGLWLSNTSFGFMSLLGLLALVGISVNNIILLLEALQESGSLEAAIKSRIRAIFLTTTLTLAGLIPLAFDKSTLWPPLAWTMISGLMTGTVATLIVVPALYRVFFKSDSLNARAINATLLAGLLGLNTNSSQAKDQVSFLQILSRVDAASESASIDAEVDFERNQESIQYNDTWFPKAYVGAEAFQRNDHIYTKSPFGKLKGEEKSRLDLKAEIQQKIFDKSAMFSGREAATENLRAAELKSIAEKTEIRFKFGLLIVSLSQMNVQIDFLNTQIKNLKKRMKDLSALIDRGRVSSADYLRLDILKERAQQDLSRIEIERAHLEEYLITKKILNTGEQVGWNFEKLQLPAQLSPSDKNSESASLELRSLISKSESLGYEAEKVRDANWPQVSVFVRGLRSEGRNLVEPMFAEVGARLAWEIPIDGVRKKQVQSIASKKRQVEASVDSLRDYQASEVSKHREKIANLVSWREKLVKLSKRSSLTKDGEQQKYIEGRIGLSDLIEADNLYVEIERDLKLAWYEIVQCCLSLEKLHGEELRGCQIIL